MMEEGNENKENPAIRYEVVEIPTWYGSRIFGRNGLFAYTKVGKRDLLDLQHYIAEEPPVFKGKSQKEVKIGDQSSDDWIKSTNNILAEMFSSYLNVSKDEILQDPLLNPANRLHVINEEDYKKYVGHDGYGHFKSGSDEVFINLDRTRVPVDFCAVYAEEITHRLMVRLYEQSQENSKNVNFSRFGLDLLEGRRSKLYGQTLDLFNEGIASYIAYQVRQKMGQEVQIDSKTYKAYELYYLAFKKISEEAGIGISDFFKAMTTLPTSGDKDKDPMWILLNRLDEKGFSTWMELDGISKIIRHKTDFELNGRWHLEPEFERMKYYFDMAKGFRERRNTKAQN